MIIFSLKEGRDRASGICGWTNGEGPHPWRSDAHSEVLGILGCVPSLFHPDIMPEYTSPIFLSPPCLSECLFLWYVFSQRVAARVLTQPSGLRTSPTLPALCPSEDMLASTFIPVCPIIPFFLSCISDHITAFLGRRRAMGVLGACQRIGQSCQYFGTSATSPHSPTPLSFLHRLCQVFLRLG